MQEQPPSYTQSHDPQSLIFPSVPAADPPSVHHERILPPLTSAPSEPRLRAEEHQFVWPSSNPLTAYYQPGPSQLSPKSKTSSHGMDSPSTMDIDTPDNRGGRGGSVLSIDDPDVRLAAEALGDLRAGMSTNLYLISQFTNNIPQTSYNLPRNSIDRYHPIPRRHFSQEGRNIRNLYSLS